MALVYPSQRVMRKRVFPDGAVAGAGDPYWSSVVALLHFDGTDGSTTITDSKGLHTWECVNGAKISTAQSKFGGSSGFLDGVNDFFRQSDAASSDFNLNGDFTWEIFGYFSSLSTCRFYCNNTNNIILGYNNTTHVITWTHGASTYSSSWTPSASTWYHLASCRSGSSIRLFVDGVQAGTTKTDSTNVTANSKALIGAGSAGNSPLNGYVDEARITNAARYTSNFSPPTAPFPNS